MRTVSWAVAAVLLSGVAASASQARDFFVITATFDSQAQAQQRAAELGGWAVDTDLYTGLEPHRFAVVRGPFNNLAVARSELRSLGASEPYRGAYVKDAGVSRLAALGNSPVPSAVIAALLGELLVDVEDRTGATNGCEPAEPYQDVKLSWVAVVCPNGVDHCPDSTRRTPIELGAFRIIKRTGEIDRMRACFE